MNRKLIVGVLVALLISGGAMIANAKISDKNTSDTEITASNKVEMISKEEAKHAVLNEVSGDNKEIELEKENGKAFYEVEVENEDYEYEFYVDTETGDTFFDDKEDRDDGADDDYLEADGSNDVDIISVEDAKKRVLKEVNGEIEEIELEKENGKAFYEVEVENEDYEYEFYVDAKTGDTFLIEKEARDDDDDDD